MPVTGFFRRKPFFTQAASGDRHAHRTILYIPSLLILLAALAFGILSAPTTTLPVHAADTDFSDGITVDSTLDTPDDNIGDGICDDGVGNCTLRAAIQEANANPDNSTILFDITGTPDFTNNSQNGYTIAPQSALPNITEQVTINGYSQPGSLANTAIAPNPLNGRLLIEISGINTGSVVGLTLATGSQNSTISGLVLNNWGSSAILLSAADISISGNYIGTDPTGMLSNANARIAMFSGAITNSGSAATGLTIGGLSPNERNLISGNNASGIAQGADHWTYYGNYIGIAADGLTSLGNSRNPSDLSGGATIDFVDGATIGGTQPGAANVWSGNDNAGVSPYSVSNFVVQGNYFGVGYDGSTPVPNDTGFHCGNCSNILVGGDDPAARNIISGNDFNGIGIDGNSDNIQIYNNYIGLDKTGLIARPNKVGITVSDSTNTTIGGTSSSRRNLISANSFSNIVYYLDADVTGGSYTTVQGNYIGVDANGAINPSFSNGIGLLIHGPSQNDLIGGTSPGSGNIIAGNAGGVVVANYTLSGLSMTLTPNKVALLGNSIYSNSTASPLPGVGQSLGIDLLGLVENGFPPNPFTSDSSTNSGVTPNDPTDSDTGPNGYINFPVLNSVTQNGSTATINFNLDAADSPTDQYRVEFFANDQADPSGYGEGQTFLGSATVSNGDNQQTSFTLPNNINLTGKSISATTTAIDNTTSSGFGATSEFSQIRLASVITEPGTSTQGGLAGTGENVRMILMFAITLLIIGIAVTVGLRKKARRL